MYLKSLSIRGFKSFADKTIIEFDPLGGITAIVGPNGCGKSNLVDAVRWVLGEQNSKELRSSLLEEIIFAGTVSRSPLSLAEVNISLDNSDNKIKSDFSEIAIKRRTFRSGESEFQINKTTCRLKDIRDLFLDTGLGNGSYSIINQGQVDEILSSKPEDRRRVFEEAARINKYKFRKKAAERKLISTEQNLLRISDLKSEITNQLSALSVQAEAARQFNKLKDELKALDIGIAKRQLRNLSDRKESIAKKIDEFRGQASQNLDYTKQIEQQKNRNKEELFNLEREIESLRLEISQTKLSYEEAKSEILLNREKERYLEEQLHRTKDELTKLLPQLDSLKTSLSLKKNDEKASLEKLKGSEKELKSVESEIQSINNDQAKMNDETERAKTEILELENRLTEERNRRFELESNIKFVKEESRRDMDLLKKLEEERSALMSEKNNILAGLASAQESLRENKSGIDSLSKLIKSRQEELAGLQKQIMEKKESFDAGSSKHEIFTELQKNYEGYPKGIREALRASEKNNFGTVYGTVSDRIKVDPEHETAVSVALASRSMDIIVENDSTAQEIIKYLKTNNLGRATFIPLNLLKGEDQKQQLPDHKGVIAFASSLVRTEERFLKVIEYLLGRTIVVDNMKNAIEISKKKIPFKIVTLEGEYIPGYGTITGGSMKRSSMTLGRERELLALEEELKNLKDELGKLNSNKDALSLEISTRENEVREFFETDSKLNIELAKSDQTRQLIDKKLDSINDEIEMINGSINARNAEANEMGNKRNKIDSSILNVQARLEEANEALKKGKEVSISYDEKKEKLSSRFLDAKVMFSNAQINLEHVTEETERIMSGIENLESLIGSKNEGDIKEKIKSIRSSTDKLENNLPKLNDNERKLSASLEEMQSKRIAAQKESETFEEKLRSFTGQDMEIKDALSKEEVSLAKIDGEISTIDQRMNEEYNLTFEQIMNADSEVTNVNQTRDEINSLRQKISELGPVNLLAIDEFDKAKERIGFIEKQYGDLMIARENLNNLIKELDGKAKIEFLNTIKIVNEHFSDIFASLFDGGEAKITLSSDEDILEGGIDIVAKPGGKKWLSLSVMSGGERALTAISLLFALLKTHPSPFCFLDEVDAALDEANIHRFSKLLKNFSKSTQIILITHNKQTMSMADTLYGITMGEPGVSKVISAKFSKVTAQ